MKKFIHVNEATSAAAVNDEESSYCFPVSSIKAIGTGAMGATGAVTNSNTKFYIALKPYNINSTTAGAASNVLGDNIDIISVTLTTNNNQQAAINKLIRKINSNRATEDGFIDLFDGVTGVKFIDDISAVEVITSAANS